MTLRIGRRAFDVVDLRDAVRVYCRERDASGFGASDFPSGKVGKLRISYNGRLWSGDAPIDPATGEPY